MLTGALKRDEYMRMKGPLYEFSFLESLFGRHTDGRIVSDSTATVIFITPSFTKKEEDATLQESPRLAPVLESVRPESVQKENITNIPYLIKRRETLTGISKKFGVGLQSIIKANQLINPGLIKANTILMIPIPNEFIYTVKPKETIWRLAKRYGTTTAVLKDLNSLEDVTSVKVGQKLVLPVAAAKIVNPQF